MGIILLKAWTNHQLVHQLNVKPEAEVGMLASRVLLSPFLVHFHGGAGVVVWKDTRHPQTHDGVDVAVDRSHCRSDRVLLYGGGDFPVADLRRLLQTDARAGDTAEQHEYKGRDIHSQPQSHRATLVGLQ